MRSAQGGHDDDRYVHLLSPSLPSVRRVLTDFLYFSSSFLIGTPSGNVLATPLAEVTQTIDLINNRPGSNITFKLRVVWTKGTTSKKKTVEVKL